MTEHRGPLGSGVTVRWLTPPPSSIDERLVVGGDGRARLDVLRPRTRGDTLGTFEGDVGPDELRELLAAGPEVELNVVIQNPGVAAVGVVAARVAERLKDSPLAAAQFFARAVGASTPAAAALAVGVLGRGSRPVAFELDVAQCAIHFSAAGSPVSWLPLPELPMGFMTPDAEGLGGVRQRALVPPGSLGAISVQVNLPESADAFRVQLAGRWYLAGEEMPESFEAWTDEAPSSG